MKVLIAEDHPVTRRILLKTLESAHYTVELVEDGSAALSALQVPDAPTIALLDWMMPGLDGPEVCRRVRSNPMKVRPYVIIVSAKTQKTEIAAALDAGADDFISKPISPDELLARLRVAERSIRHQVELRDQIEQLDALSQRYALLGEIVAQQLQPRSEDETEPAPFEDASGGVMAPPAPPTVAATGIPKTWLERADVETLTVRALTDLGLSVNPTVAPPGDRAAGASSYTAWAGFVDTRDQRWIDVVMEIDERSATLVHERALKRPAGSKQEISRFLAETHTVIGSAFRTALQAKGYEVLAPLRSRAQQRDLWEPALRYPSESVCYRFDLDGAVLDLVVIFFPCAMQTRPPGQPKANEILAETYPPASSSAAAPILVRGSALTPHFIREIASYSTSMRHAPPLKVYPLSPIAGRFHRPAELTRRDQ